MSQNLETSGTALTEVESKVLAIYGDLKMLLERDDCPPCVLFAARQALATMYPAINALGLGNEFLIEYGI